MSRYDEAVELQEQLIKSFRRAFPNPKSSWKQFGQKRQIVVSGDLQSYLDSIEPTKAKEKVESLLRLNPTYVGSEARRLSENAKPPFKNYDDLPDRLKALLTNSSQAAEKIDKTSQTLGFSWKGIIYIKNGPIDAYLLAHEMAHCYTHAKWSTLMQALSFQVPAGYLDEGMAELIGRKVVEVWKKGDPAIDAGEMHYTSPEYIGTANAFTKAMGENKAWDAFFGEAIEYDEDVKHLKIKGKTWNWPFDR